MSASAQRRAEEEQWHGQLCPRPQAGAWHRETRANPENAAKKPALYINGNGKPPGLDYVEFTFQSLT